MAALTTRVVTRTGNGVLLGAAAASGGGDTFTNDGNTFLYVKNGSGGSITVTVAIPYTVDNVAVSTGKALVVAAGEERLFGPFPTGIYTDPNTGNVSLTYSGVTSLTVAAVKSIPVG